MIHCIPSHHNFVQKTVASRFLTFFKNVTCFPYRDLGSIRNVLIASYRSGLSYLKHVFFSCGLGYLTYSFLMYRETLSLVDNLYSIIMYCFYLSAGFQFSLSNAGEGKSNGGEYIVRVVNGGELF